jgi:hypothetical protein
LAPNGWKFLLLFSKRSAFFLFFFEKKNQKTFIHERNPRSPDCPGPRVAALQLSVLASNVISPTALQERSRVDVGLSAMRDGLTKP